MMTPERKEQVIDLLATIRELTAKGMQMKVTKLLSPENTDRGVQVHLWFEMTLDEVEEVNAEQDWQRRQKDHETVREFRHRLNSKLPLVQP